VHHVLGRHRADDTRSAWISGLGEAEGGRHPTAGGLRIGKPLTERGPREPFDSRLEWERDGQYYHYLVRWMHALSRAGSVLGDADLQRWAVELAVAAERAFTYTTRPSGATRMHWKMSIDVSRPLVPSQGAHDPLDGFVTACAVAAGGADSASGTDLRRCMRELAPMCWPQDWVTADALGAGGLLCDVWWSVQLLTREVPERELLEPMLGPMVAAALASLEALSRSSDFALPPAQRLAFRELGLVIGLQAAAALVAASPGLPARLRLSGIDELERHLPLAERITSTWLEPASRSTSSWLAHEDINDVMLATALAPDEYLRA